MRYLLISLKDTAVAGELSRSLDAGGFTDVERDALARAFERTLRTSDLLVTYALAIAEKPCRQWAKCCAGEPRLAA